ncbi:hypothetical protein ODZ84_21115 [Chryseobacterium fluminis]|uniref:hypothetical protein n=1 Tax=Chryseobacterium fluminis TaxID=2983606 RepID=UPI00224FEC35|nr:hypothetical protein [Chryseobacterium sp. MMS21-Ot14]UZT97645.1 hypothetical protein ODZ84_21115 [Chryseobacterium sp. MMS21-Ot14]
MKSPITLLVIIISFFECKSQEINNKFDQGIDFKYSRIYYKDATVIESNIYDSSTGLYKYNENNFGFGKDKNVSTIIKLKEKELRSIYQSYLSLNPKYLSEYIYKEGKLLYKSTIEFKTRQDKMLNNNDCSDDKNDQERYAELETLVYRLIVNSPAYKKCFYWEFIKK